MVMLHSGSETNTTSSKRDLLLEELALDAARVWTTALLTGLAAEGREVEGGWPGTISDARARIHDLALRSLLRHAMPSLDHDELGRLTRRTYDEARRLWRAQSSG